MSSSSRQRAESSSPTRARQSALPQQMSATNTSLNSRSRSANPQGQAAGGDALNEIFSSSASQQYPGSHTGAQHRGFLHAAPAGRVQATDFLPPPVSSPLLRSSESPHLSPSLSRHPPPESSADLSSLGSDEGLGSVDGDEHEDDDEGDDDGEGSRAGWGGHGSIFSQATSMFDPNLYLHAQEAWRTWEQQNGGRSIQIHVDEEDHLTEAGESVVSSRIEQMSERASLMGSSLAHRRAYGALPPQDSAISGSRHMWRTETLERPGLSAIHEQVPPEHATLVDAMKTADIGGTPGSNLGLILVAISQLCFSLMNLFVTLLDRRDGEKAPGRGPDNPPLTALEIVFVECLVMHIGAVAAMLLFRTPNPLLGPPGVRLLLVARGIFGFLATLFLYISLQALSLSDATSITFLGPLTTGVAAAVLLSEPFTIRQRVAGVGSLVGVLMIARPSAIFGSGDAGGAPVSGGGDTPPIEGGDDASVPTEDSSKRVMGVIIALLGVMSTSGAWVSLRKIGRSASTYHSIAYFAMCSWTLSLAGMLALGEPFVMPSTIESCILLFIVGLTSLLAQTFQVLGLQRETAGRAAMMSYLQIIFATLFQVTLLGTPLELLSVAGSVLVLANGAWVAMSNEGSDGVMAH